MKGWSKLKLDEINKMAASGEKEEGKKPKKNKPAKSSDKLLKDLPKLSAFEIVLLGVVVVVFAFIGILAASAIFDFDLPISALSGAKVTEGLPPYAGVFCLK